MPLTMVNVGEKNFIKKITGKDETKKFLTKLGFTEGADITIVSEFSGSIILNARGARVALDKSMARRIIV